MGPSYSSHFLSSRHKERKKQLAREKLGTKPTSDESITTLLEEDEEIGQTDSNDGLSSLLDNVGDLLENDDGAAAVAGTVPEESVRSESDSLHSNPVTPRTYRSIQQSLEEMDAPSELRQATALLLQSTLLDEDTARLLTHDILDQPMEVAEKAERYMVDDDVIEGDGQTKQSSEDCHDAAVAEESQTEDDVYASVKTDEEEESTAKVPPTENDDMLRPSIFTMHSQSDGQFHPDT